MEIGLVAFLVRYEIAILPPSKFELSALYRINISPLILLLLVVFALKTSAFVTMWCAANHKEYKTVMMRK
ncbi:hypothetical protein T4E_1065 [Trichinella pseudospiralis]|uniref:Uncharacterized protein n=1 Tax=Trichinella pseudospiralis TaxID=6337 RepID=A0A0V0Y8K3_TRIPS|nr:hypothetical protein T4E_3757 [Trichinella pseudospiralis]KRX96575.1 hypothetical protein T4E_1065 [Trichinella pseudospiralis]